MNANEESSFSLDLQQLASTRIQLHYAIQPLAAIANVYPDPNHRGLGWDEQLGFITHVVIMEKTYTVALDPISLTLEFVTDPDTIISSFALSDRALSEAFVWIKELVSELGGSGDLVVPITYPPDDFPDSDLARGATFNLENISSLFAEYYAAANHILQYIVESESMASSVRLWPHHFDIATLISIPAAIDGEEKTVGVGLSPGDSSYAKPYWYVTPYPYPENTDDLPVLASDGIWHKEHWVGAVLTASQFGDPIESEERVKTFLISAIAACKKLLT
ncbi:MAG: hypothetical protein DCF19_20845 [Pseudanabaena frigida]|uniref:Uncharacterized protein n=1 Tax=Pseudanabaena frigida TaxID=945775 RepID=A0A2W4VZI0_9CYAN|nr:MAG: hypothetical protein DCF19_20845 [Pseudanabaena frigida]